MKNVIQGTTLSGTGAVSIAPGAEITIRNPAGQLVPLWADRAGTQPHDNPFLTDNEGNFRVYADSGWVHVRAQKDGSVREWRYVPLGSAAAMDIGEVYEALGSEIYPSVSEGLSNSAEGDFFLVESEGALDLYRVVNGVAEQRAAGIDDNAILATRVYADGVAAEAESNATNAAVAAASAAYQQATEYSDSQLQTHRGSDDHDHRYYTKTEVDQALSTKVDDDDPRLSDPREWTAEVVSQSEAEEGASSVPRKWTAERVRQAIVAGYNALTSAFGRTLANASDATAARNTLGLGTAATHDVGTGANNVVVGSDTRLSDAREWIAPMVTPAEVEDGESTEPRKWSVEMVRLAAETYGGSGSGIIGPGPDQVRTNAENDARYVRPPDLYIGKPTADPATPITGSLLSGAMLAAGAIVEMGENANGSYWRWESGLQVCFGRVSFVGSGTGNRTATWTLPAAFASKTRYIPLLLGSYYTTFSSIGLSSSADSSLTAISASFGMVVTLAQAENIAALTVAIGWWK